MNKALLTLFLKLCLLLCNLFALQLPAFTQNPARDTVKCKGYAAITGLIQTGDETRTVFSLLSVLKIGTRKYEMEPLTSIAYSTKPGKQVEKEYLENIILRYRQHNTFYPAIGVGLEHSLLRKINFRYTLSAAAVYNAIHSKSQTLKLALGYSHEYTKFEAGAFVPAIGDKPQYARQVGQLYSRVKGEHNIGKLKITYDIFYQAALKKFADRRWFVIGNIDYAVAKHLSIRASGLNSFEEFRATGVSQNNFRLTYGINIQF